MKSSPRCAPLSELMKNPPSASIIEDLEDLYENAPCGYLSLDPGGRIFKVNKTLCNWVGYAPEHLLGKRLGDLLNIAGRMFYETHIAPLLRMQGFFNEVALDLVSQNGDRLPVIANATERRAADGASSRLALPCSRLPTAAATSGNCSMQGTRAVHRKPPQGPFWKMSAGHLNSASSSSPSLATT